jgi:hypothetical protein
MQKNVAQRWIDHHLEAASSYAEEDGDTRAQEIIDRAREELGNFRCSLNKNEFRPVKIDEP